MVACEVCYSRLDSSSTTLRRRDVIVTNPKLAGRVGYRTRQAVRFLVTYVSAVLVVDFKRRNRTHRPRTLHENQIGVLVNGSHFLHPNLRFWITSSPYKVSRNNIPLYNTVLGLRFCFFAEHFFEPLWGLPFEKFSSTRVDAKE